MACIDLSAFITEIPPSYKQSAILLQPIVIRVLFLLAITRHADTVRQTLVEFPYDISITTQKIFHEYAQVIIFIVFL